MVSLGFEFAQCSGSNGLDLGDDVVGIFALNDGFQFIGIKHVEHIAAMSHLHGRSVGVTVASNHLHAVTL